MPTLPVQRVSGTLLLYDQLHHPNQYTSFPYLRKDQSVKARIGHVWRPHGQEVRIILIRKRLITPPPVELHMLPFRRTPLVFMGAFRPKRPSSAPVGAALGEQCRVLWAQEGTLGNPLLKHSSVGPRGGKRHLHTGMPPVNSSFRHPM